VTYGLRNCGVAKVTADRVAIVFATCSEFSAAVQFD
jgi:hypothetical protein